MAHAASAPIHAGKGASIYIGAVLLAVFRDIEPDHRRPTVGHRLRTRTLGRKDRHLVRRRSGRLTRTGAAKHQQLHIESSLLTDVTSVTNLGLLMGALIAANFRGHARPRTKASGKQWLVALITGFVLGYRRGSHSGAT